MKFLDKLLGIPRTFDEFIEWVKAEGRKKIDILLEGHSEAEDIMGGLNRESYILNIRSGNKKLRLKKYNFHSQCVLKAAGLENNNYSEICKDVETLKRDLKDAGLESRLIQEEYSPWFKTVGLYGAAIANIAILGIILYMNRSKIFSSFSRSELCEPPTPRVEVLNEKSELLKEICSYHSIFCEKCAYTIEPPVLVHLSSSVPSWSKPPIGGDDSLEYAVPHITCQHKRHHLPLSEYFKGDCPGFYEYKQDEVKGIKLNIPVRRVDGKEWRSYFNYVSSFSIPIDNIDENGF